MALAFAHLALAAAAILARPAAEIVRLGLDAEVAALGWEARYLAQRTRAAAAIRALPAALIRLWGAFP